MGVALDLIGQKFARLEVISFAGRRNGRRRWCCRCVCNEIAEVALSDLRSGAIRSCGCLAREILVERNKSQKMRNVIVKRNISQEMRELSRARFTTHGMCRSPIYAVRMTARDRCRNKKNESYPRYGGRGIEFRFKSFKEFYAELGPRPSPQHTLDRINNNGHYERGNVRWATAIEQANNKRNNHRVTAFGETKSLSDWSRVTSFPASAIKKRLKRRWDAEKTLTMPVRPLRYAVRPLGLAA